MPFYDVKDELAREFLGDVLFARVSRAPGYMDYSMNIPEGREDGYGDGAA